MKIIARHGETDVRTWDLIVSVTGYLPGGLVDWPANIAEPILQKAEELEKEIGLPLQVTFSQCEMDDRGFFLRVIVQYIPVFEEAKVQ